MARLSKNLFGIPKGRIGEVVFKCLRGTPYISARPSKYEIKMTEYHINKRKIFSFSTRFCSTLNKLIFIKNFWETIEKSAYNRMMKANLKKLTDGGTFRDLFLMPEESSIICMLTECHSGIEGLSLSFTQPGELIKAPVKWISVQGIMCFENPTEENYQPYRFINLYSGDYNAIPGEYMTFEINFTNQESEIYKAYSSKKILINLIAKDGDGMIKNYSANIFLEV